jgi:hypothetical protein
MEVRGFERDVLFPSIMFPVEVEALLPSDVMQKYFFTFISGFFGPLNILQFSILGLPKLTAEIHQIH